MTLRDYRILPEKGLATATLLVLSIESILALSWLFQIAPVLNALASAALLGVYSFAIGINLARGRVHISCGCGFAAATDAGTPISSGLILRNGALILILLASLLPSNGRELIWIDYIVTALSSVVAILLYISISQLLNNNASIASWRTS